MLFASVSFNTYPSLSNNHVGWQLFAYLQNYSLFFQKIVNIQIVFFMKSNKICCRIIWLLLIWCYSPIDFTLFVSVWDTWVDDEAANELLEEDSIWNWLLLDWNPLEVDVESLAICSNLAFAALVVSFLFSALLKNFPTSSFCWPSRSLLALK